MVRAVFLICFGLALGLPAAAQERAGAVLGFGVIGANDGFGDGNDRWRSASLTTSLLWGPPDQRGAPARFGRLLEVRFSAELITPSDIDRPGSNDRAYASILSLGLHSHLQRGAIQARIGADLVMVGPQTGLDDLQTLIHRRLDGQPSPAAAAADQIENTFRLAASGEIAQSWPLADHATLRPFAEAQIGDETYSRVGVDLILGGLGHQSPLLRDPVTGQLYLAQAPSEPGVSLVAGLDLAAFADSLYLPSDRAADLEPVQGRLRLGVHWRSSNISAHYGLTYLTPEFAQQGEGQLLGSAWLRLAF